MNKQITLLLFGLILFICETKGQTDKPKFNYNQGTVTLKNGTILQGEVANIKHGFRDELLNKVRIKLPGKSVAKKYHPREILGYSIGNLKFVSWQVKHNIALFKETYTLYAGKEYKIFELQKEGHLSIYIEHFYDGDLQIGSAPYFLKKNELIMVRATQGMFGLKRKLLADYFVDCLPLIELIEEKKVNTPEEVAHYYNNYFDEQLQIK